MEKRYQVFLSSTYTDLKDERQNVIQALMEMDCIPAGMELFPAADEEQWKFIQRVIDDCDYYLLIIGGRYGSLTPEGMSYTEKEFDYAVSKNIKVVALLHGEPQNIPIGKSDIEPGLRERLDLFKVKVSSGRLVKKWSTASELPGLVALSLTKTIKAYPTTGWVRGGRGSSEQLLLELNQLRKDNADLRERVLRLSATNAPAIQDIADLDASITLRGTYKGMSGSGAYNRQRRIEPTITWRRLYSLLSPYLISHPSDASVRLHLSEIMFRLSEAVGVSPRIDEEDFETIRIQFQAYGLIDVAYLATTTGTMGLFWSNTDAGSKLMMETRVVRN